MRDVARRLTTRGLRRALSGVADELAILRRHRAAVSKARTLSLPGDLRVQLGSGGQPTSPSSPGAIGFARTSFTSEPR